MPKCSKCRKEDGPFEKWGDCHFCPDCVKYVKETWGIPPTDNISDLTIMSKTYRTNCNPATGQTELYHEAYRLGVEAAINHEFIHYLLHKMVGIKCSFDFDNIRQIIKPYHNSNTTRDPNHTNYLTPKLQEIDYFSENAVKEMKALIEKVEEEDKYYIRLSNKK